MIKNFFTDENFVKRVELHQMNINSSKTKKKIPLTLYYMEISPNQRLLNLIAQKDA